jgi:ATP-binding cassette subfamily B protein
VYYLFNSTGCHKVKLSPLLKRLWVHVAPRRRKQLGLLFALVVITSFTEVVAIGAVLPFLAVLSKPETVFSHELAQPLIKVLELTAPQQLVLPITVIFALAAVVSGVMRIAMLWGQARLGQAIGADLSYQVYRRTLFQPYSVHVARNSSEVIAAVTSKTNQVVAGIVLPVLMMTGSVLLMVAILATLISISPIIALSGILGFGTIYGVIVWVTKKRLLIYSHRISDGGNQVVKIVQEGLGGIRDILIDGAQSTYCKSFRTVDVSMRRAQANSQVISLTPRYGIESLSMVLIAVIAFSLVGSSGGLIDVLPVLGAFVVGAQRLLPALQLIYANLSSMRTAQIVLVDILSLIEQPLPNYTGAFAQPPLSFERSIKINDLGFRYASDAPWVLRGLNIEIRKGSRVGFIGSTGSGKSTLLDIVMGLLHPVTGTLTIDDKPITEENYRSWQAHIAHVPQAIFLSDATIAENIAFGVPVEQIDLERVCQAARQAQIAETIESWKSQYETIVGERGMRLSGGQRQRIGIARALYKQADVIVFDEATSALDNETEQAVMDTIDNIAGETTILIVAHRLTTLKKCDQVVELENGTIKRFGVYEDIVA